MVEAAVEAIDVMTRQITGDKDDKMGNGVIEAAVEAIIICYKGIKAW